MFSNDKPVRTIAADKHTAFTADISKYSNATAMLRDHLHGIDQLNDGNITFPPN